MSKDLGATAQQTGPIADAPSLLPCPFCGGEAERVDNGPTKKQVQHAIAWGNDYDDGGSYIRCMECDVSTPLHFGQRPLLESAWNSRFDKIDCPICGRSSKADSTTIYCRDCGASNRNPEAKGEDQ